MRIPNWLPLLIIVSYAIWVILTQQAPIDVIRSIAVSIAILFITFLLFAKGVLGGGDGKLIAAVALWLGWSPYLLQYLIIAGVLGGILSLFALSIRNLACYLPMPIWLPDWMVKNGCGVPYGVALGIAGLIILPDIITKV